MRISCFSCDIQIQCMLCVSNPLKGLFNHLYQVLFCDTDIHLMDYRTIITIEKKKTKHSYYTDVLMYMKCTNVI